MKTSHLKLDVGKFLVIAAAAYQAYQFGRALAVYDPAGWQLYGVSLGGLMLGVIVNVIVALAATRLPAIKGKTRIPAAWTGFALLLVLSPALIAPGLYLLFENLAMPEGLQIFLSIGLASAPDLAIAVGGFVAGKSLIPLLNEEKSHSETERTARGRRARKGHRSAAAQWVACRFAGAGCEEIFGSQNAENAHARWCKFKPTISMPAEEAKK